MEACSKHGTATVHAAVDAWATPHTIEWMASKNVRSQFGLFLSQLDKTIEHMADDKTVDIAMIDASAVAEKAPDVLINKEAVDATDLAILQMAEDEERRRTERRDKFSSSEPEAVVDPEKFLED